MTFPRFIKFGRNVVYIPLMGMHRSRSGNVRVAIVVATVMLNRVFDGGGTSMFFSTIRCHPSIRAVGL